MARRIALAVCAAAVFGGAPSAAWAAISSGCTAVNGGALDNSGGNVTNYQGTFFAGEVLTGTYHTLSGSYMPAYIQLKEITVTPVITYIAQTPNPTDGSTVTLTLHGGVNYDVVQSSIAASGTGSGTYSLTVVCTGVMSGTTTSVTSNSNPSRFGETVTFTAAVTSGGGTPTGSVQFAIDGSNVGSAVVLDGNGQAALSTAALTIAGSPHAVTAVYTPADTGFAGSSGTLSGGQTVVKADTSVSVVRSPAGPAYVYGQPVTFTATVSANTPGVGTPTGTVTFNVNGSAAATMMLVNGQAQFSSSTIPTGTTFPSVTYNGDANFNSSAGTAGETTVVAAATTTALSAAPNPSTAGQSATFTATVTAVSPSTATPTGTVTFTIDGTAQPAVALTAGAASFSTATLTGGTHSVSAAYAPSSSFTASSSSTLTQTVNKATSTTALSSAPNPSTFGQSVTLTATVTGQTPTGTVTFKDGATTIGSGSVNSSGVATFATTALAVGPHSITAAYGGDTSNAASTSAATTQTVNQATSTTVISAAPNPSTFGQSVTLTATVTGQTPTGTVTFKDGATTIGTGSVNTSGVASFATTALAVGPHSITAAYGGDTSNAASTSAATTQTVNQATSTTALSSAPNPSTFGQSVALTATVTGQTPTGTVTFKDGATTIGSGSVNSSGVATFATTSLAAGTHSLTATYGGDTSNAASTSAATTQTVSADTSITVLTSSQNPSVYGDAISLTATVSRTGSTQGQATGMVSFRDGTTVLGTAPVSAGVATYTTSALSPGAHRLSASYGGDGNVGVSTSADLVQTVILSCKDGFADATMLPGRSGTVVGSTTSATGETGEPNHAGNSTPLNSVWCRWTASSASPVTLDTTGSGFDTTLAVYTGSSLGALTPVASDDNIAANTVQSRVSFTPTPGTSYMIALDGAGAATGNYLLNFAQAPAQPQLAAAVLPTARSVQTNGFATAFATLMNSGTAAATQCSIALPPFYPALLTYQTTNAQNALTGTPDTPVDIPAGGSQAFAFGIVPTVELNSADVALVFSCTNTEAALTIAGVNTLGLSSSATAPPDLVAIGATTSNDGIVTVPAGGQAFFSAAAINIGAAGTITATVDDDSRDLPLTVTLCESNPNTGACVNPPAAGSVTSRTMAPNDIVTYTVFVTAQAAVPFDPANSRLFLRLKTPDNVTRGATSVAVRTP